MLKKIDNIKQKSWPFQEALRILNRYKDSPPAKGYILFETGYGPSGLPHIGTFGEVARTTMVRNAFKKISSIPTKLIAFSDDLDGLRKLPDNIPNKEEINNYLGRSLTNIPDPLELIKVLEIIIMQNYVIFLMLLALIMNLKVLQKVILQENSMIPF